MRKNKTYRSRNGNDLGIGGCWNESCSFFFTAERYVIQLDFRWFFTIQRKLCKKSFDTLRRDNYAMVVGSYTIVQWASEKSFPGLIGP